MATNLNAQNSTFTDWDTDGDLFVEQYEFTDTFTDKYFEDWDNTDDTDLDDEDFYQVTYSIVDEDDDELIDEEEWDFGYDYYYGDYLYDDYLIYDTDGDDMISYDEYYEALYESDYYSTWDIDRDTYLNEYELAESVFNNWDVNDNGLISESEYKSFDSYYLDL